MLSIVVKQSLARAVEGCLKHAIFRVRRRLVPTAAQKVGQLKECGASAFETVARFWSVLISNVVGEA